ncbi:hypothetical protein [Nocardia nova]|uniref:hypothetical protein n=1 Tax=Nocardia nova TaxID=37330 RepID=UPI002738FF8E|nr:hypothetical protein [Nocardia nova]
MSGKYNPDGFHLDPSAGAAVFLNIGPWSVMLEWPKGATQGGPTRIEILPSADATPDELAGGLSSTVLRQINFKEAADMWREGLKLAAGLPSGGIGRRSEVLRSLIDRDGVSDEYLAHLSEAYVYLVASGTHNVAGTLGEMVGRTSGAVLQQLKRARKANLLTSIPGRAGGQLTPKAAEILARPGQQSD